MPAKAAALAPMKAARRDPFKHLSSDEMRLAKLWYTEDDMEPSEIAALLRRDKSTMTRLLVMQKERQTQGRPPCWTKPPLTSWSPCWKTWWWRRADSTKSLSTCCVAGRAAKRATGRSRTLCAAESCISARLREKPVLTDADVQARKAFAKQWVHKSERWWLTFLDMHIDVKHFPVYLSGRARAHAAREAVRGAYRTRGQGLEAPYVKHGQKYKYNPGARGVMVLAGVGHGQVLVWEVIDGRNWNGEVAAEMYSGPIKQALQRAAPSKPRW